MLWLRALVGVFAATYVQANGLDVHHRLSEEYPDKFGRRLAPVNAKVIPNQYIVMLHSNHTRITTQPINAQRKLTNTNTTNQNAQGLLSSLLHANPVTEQRDAEFQVTIEQIYTYVIDGFSARMSPLAVRYVLEDPDVLYVEPDFIASVNPLNSSSVAFVQRNPPWNLDRIDQSSPVLDQQYDTGTLSGKGVDIYVLDTGINKLHADFRGRIGGVADFVKDNRDGVDCNGHGTHCASTALGSKWGVAKDATLYSARVLGCDGEGGWSSILGGLDWSIGNIQRASGRIGVISLSLGGPNSPIFDRAVANAVNKGAVVVVAGGNEDTNACSTSPANEPLAIAVGASTDRDRRATFSNYGTCIDIYAPGQSIRAADYRSTTGSTVLSGTSMATPHVSGAAALAIQQQRLANAARITPQSVRTELLSLATRGALSNLRGGPNLLLRVPYGQNEDRVPTPVPTPSPTCRTTDGDVCVFPFVFRGERYDACTTSSDRNGRQWCSTRTNPTTDRHVTGFWGYCDPRTCDPDCAVFTDTGETCVFPFRYKGELYNTCTTADDPQGRTWCSTQTRAPDNTHVQGAWGHCVDDPPKTNRCDPAPTPTRPTPVPPRPTPRPQRPTLRPTPRASLPTLPPDECALFNAINNVRALHRLPPLQLDSRLQRAAVLHSRDMATRDYFAHVSPDGSTPADRVSGEGYQWQYVSENIAAGYPSTEDVVNGWVNSAGHFKNIKCTSCTRTGIARVVVPNSKWTYYYTQVFANGDDDPNTLVRCADFDDDDPVLPPAPTATPSENPTRVPEPPSARPTFQPTVKPSVTPTATLTLTPTRAPTPVPTSTRNPTPIATAAPARAPSTAPSAQPPSDPQQPRVEDDDRRDGTCRTIAFADRSRQLPPTTCVFPFIYRNILYSRCTSVDHSRPWCATAVDPFGRFVNDQWGNCDLSVCDVEGERCQLHALDAPWTNAETRRLSATPASATKSDACSRTILPVDEDDKAKCPKMYEQLWFSNVALACVCAVNGLMLTIVVVHAWLRRRQQLDAPRVLEMPAGGRDEQV